MVPILLKKNDVDDTAHWKNRAFWSTWYWRLPLLEHNTEKTFQV